MSQLVIQERAVFKNTVQITTVTSNVKALLKARLVSSSFRIFGSVVTRHTGRAVLGKQSTPRSELVRNVTTVATRQEGLYLTKKAHAVPCSFRMSQPLPRRKGLFLKNLVPWLADPKLPKAAADKWIDYFGRADAGLGAEVRSNALLPIGTSGRL